MIKIKSKKKGSTRSQIITLIIVLTFLVVIAVIATLMNTGVIVLKRSDSAPVRYLGDAQQVCKNRIQADHVDSLQMLAVDDLSSRFDEESGQFKVFYEMSVYADASKQTGVKNLYVNCMISSASGTVFKMEYLEQKEFTGKPIRREYGNPFGF